MTFEVPVNTAACLSLLIHDEGGSEGRWPPQLRRGRATQRQAGASPTPSLSLPFHLNPGRLLPISHGPRATGCHLTAPPPKLQHLYAPHSSSPSLKRTPRNLRSPGRRVRRHDARSDLSTRSAHAYKRARCASTVVHNELDVKFGLGNIDNSRDGVGLVMTVMIRWILTSIANSVSTWTVVTPHLRKLHTRVAVSHSMRCSSVCRPSVPIIVTSPVLIPSDK